jgi:predicted Zn-dependent protease
VLKASDPAVARAIVALTESTGRNDALTLQARGNALLTLGRGAEAVKALKQARQLAPTLPEVNAHLAAAEKLARSEARKKEAAAVASVPPPTAAQATPREYSNQGAASRTN